MVILLESFYQRPDIYHMNTYVPIYGRDKDINYIDLDLSLYVYRCWL